MILDDKFFDPLCDGAAVDAFSNWNWIQWNMETTRDIADKLKDAGDQPRQAIPRNNSSGKGITVIAARRGPQKCPAAEMKEPGLFNKLFKLNPHWTTLSTLSEGIIIAANDAFYSITGYQEQEVLGRSTVSLGLWENPKEREHLKQQIAANRTLSSVPLKVRLKSGQMRDFLVTAMLIESNNEPYTLSVMVDVTAEKAIENDLKQQRQRVAELAGKVREMNTAIRVFGDAWGREKTAIQNRIKYHINVNVLPFIEKIKTSRKRGDIHTYIRIMEENLQDLSPAFSDPRGPIIEDFTPSESQIIQLVKHGQSSKEIAELLNLSTKAISFHRSNIRKKLNLVNKKVSLATFLRSQDVVP